MWMQDKSLSPTVECAESDAFPKEQLSDNSFAPRDRCEQQTLQDLKPQWLVASTLKLDDLQSHGQ